MKVLITGIAGFIGYNLAKGLISNNIEIFGIDNLNDYYDVNLKKERLKDLGFFSVFKENTWAQSLIYEKLYFSKVDIRDKQKMIELFESVKFDVVINLAAQAGVRNSIENPGTYVDNNVLGFLNILEACRNFGIKNLLYASTSSVYGSTKNEKANLPLNESQITDCPQSLYAATKKSNELMAFSYSELFDIKCIGMRFFTVYGPWGRPDMALWKFTKAISEGGVIDLYNNGDHQRDFTFVLDTVEGIKGLLFCMDKIDEKSSVFNISSGKTIKLLEMVEILESKLKTGAKKNFLPLQSGDVHSTYGDIEKIQKLTGYNPSYTLDYGIGEFVKWYLSFK